MPIQIANPTVVAKIERLASVVGLSKTATVEKAVDLLLAREAGDEAPGSMARFGAILSQLDRIPDLPGAADPFDWDDHGLPR